MMIVAEGLLAGLGVCLVISMWRWIKGPQLPDRVVLFDLATSLACGVTVVMSIVYSSDLFLDIALLLAVISFVSTIGLAYWIEKSKEI